MFFFLPIGDRPNPPGRPYVNYLLIAINVLVFLVITLPLTGRAVNPSDPHVLEYIRIISRQTGASPRLLLARTSAYDVFMFTHGFRPAAASIGTLFSSMFLHAGWLHLLGNMLFLWIFGDNVEYRLGRIPYLITYLVTGALGTLFFALFQLHSEVPLVGASGAISGVLGCYFVWFPRNKVRLLTVFIFFVNIILVPARWVLGFYLLVENLLPFILSSSASGVAHGAHIGGFAAGAVLAVGLDRLHRWRAVQGVGHHEPQVVSAPPPPPASRPQTPVSALEAFSQAAREGNWHGALREYSLMSASERHSLSDGAIFGLADYLTEQQRYDAALAVLQRFIAAHPNSPVLSRAHLRAGLINLRGLERPTAAYQHLLSVLDLHPSWEEERVAREAITEIEQRRNRRVLH